MNPIKPRPSLRMEGEEEEQGETLLDYSDMVADEEVLENTMTEEQDESNETVEDGAKGEDQSQEDDMKVTLEQLDESKMEESMRRESRKEESKLARVAAKLEEPKGETDAEKYGQAKVFDEIQLDG